MGGAALNRTDETTQIRPGGQTFSLKPSAKTNPPAETFVSTGGVIVFLTAVRLGKEAQRLPVYSMRPVKKFAFGRILSGNRPCVAETDFALTRPRNTQ